MVSWCCLWVLNRRSFLWGFSRGRLFGGGNSTPIPDLPWTSTPSLISSAYGFTSGPIFLSFFNCKTLFLLFWARKHGRSTRGAAPASDADACALVRVCIFFFFCLSQIRANSARFVSTWLDSCQIGFDSHRTELIRPKLGRIGHSRSYRPTADSAETGRKWLKHAKNGRNRPWIWSEKPKLAFFFLFLLIKA